MKPGSILQADQLLSVLNDLSDQLSELPGGRREQAEQDLQVLHNFVDNLPRYRTEQPTYQERWPEFLENMHDSFLAIDRDWNLAYINQRYARLVGREPQSLVGKNFWTEFPRYVGSSVEAHYRKAMQEKIPVHFQAVGAYSSNWYEISIYPTQEGIAIFASDRTEQHRAEGALRESIAREQARTAELEAIMNVVPAMIWIAHDRECKEMTGNAYGYEFLGMGQNENISKSAPKETLLQQQPYRNFKNGREIPTAELPMQVAASTGASTRNYEFDLVFHDGAVRTVLGNVEPLLDGNGQPSGAVAAFIDITARKQAEEALQANQRTLQLFVDHAPAAIAMFDTNMRYLAASRRFLADYHLGNQNVIGRSHYDVFPEISERWKEIHQRCMAGAVETCEEDPFPRQDGLLDWVRWEIHPWYNQQGKIGGLMMFTEVITDRKQAQDALRASQAHLAESENRFRVAISSLPITVYMLNPDLRYTWVYNPRSGIQIEHILGRRDDELYPPETAAPFIAAKQAVMDSGQRVQREIKAVLNGKTEHFLLYLEPIHDEAGTITGLIGASVNITEQRQAEWKHREALTQMEVQRRLLDYREKERQVIARELHDGPVQNLSSLIFNVQFLKDAISDPSIQLELEPILLGLKETVQNLRGMLNDLRPPSLIRFGLAKALQFYLEDFSEKHPEVILDFTLMNETDQLSEQARLNLFRIVQEGLTNVIKHAGATRVAVHLEAAGKQVLLEIEDNGAGFVIANHLVDYAVAGHFGLAGMKERAEAMGGTLQVISAPGQGTTIRVSAKLRD